MEKRSSKKIESPLATQSELVTRFCKSEELDHELFEQIYAEYFTSLFRFAKRYTNNNQEAEEVVHIAFERLLIYRQKISSNLQGWLLQVIAMYFRKRVSRENQRSITRAQNHEAIQTRLGLEAKTPYEDLLHHMGLHIPELISTIPDPQVRQVMELRFIHGIHINAVAAQMKMSRSTVLRYTQRGIDYLQGKVE